MSSLRPTSVCDTTPLQRFESQSSSGEEPSSPTVSSIIAAAKANFVTNTRSPISTTTIAPSTIVTPLTSVVPASHSSPTATRSVVSIGSPSLSNIHQNNNNNHKIELHLPNFIDGTNNQKIMKSKGILRIMRRILVDLCMLSCVALPIIYFSFWGQPNQHGFFCNDEYLKYPYKESTIRSWMLYLVCVALPIALIIIIEFYKSNDKKLQNYTNYSTTGYYFCHLALPEWLIESYKKIGILIFGCGVEQLTTNITKYSIGRLRPYFFAVCQPIMFDGSTCNDAINANRYIEHYSCLAAGNVTAKMLKDVNLSFPSAHASFTFYTMVYLTIYLQSRMNWECTKMLKHLLQFMFIMFAWYATLTRISDYKHHWTDVLAGSGIGITYAIIVTSTLW